MNAASNSPTREKNTASPTEFGPWMAQWLPTLTQAAKTYHRRQNIILALAFVVAIAVAAIGMISLQKLTFWGAVGMVGLGIVCALIVGFLLNSIFVRPLEKGRGKTIEEMRAAISQHGLSSAEIVRGIAAGIKSRGYRDDQIICSNSWATRILLGSPTPHRLPPDDPKNGTVRIWECSLHRFGSPIDRRNRLTRWEQNVTIK